MKVLFICADAGVPVFGRKGCSTHVRETCLTLLKLGHEVRLVCSNTEGDDAGRDEISVIEVAPNRSKRLGFDLRHILLDRRIERAARAEIIRWSPGAIYERYSLYSRAGTNLAHEFNLPHILEINALMTKEQENRIRLMPLAQLAERRIFARARHVVVVSDPLREDVAVVRRSDREISKMPMAVDLEKFNPGIDASDVRRKYGLENKFVLGYVGTLTGWHGISLLYHLAEGLKGAGVNDFAILVVGGDDKRLAAHRQKVEEKGLTAEMMFIGAVPHSEVPHFIRAMDVAIVPDTTYWSSPAKLFEYQGCGVPVLAPRYPAIEFAMTHKKEGWLFTPENVEEMVAGAKALHDDPPLRKSLGASGRRRAEEFHSWEKLGRSVIDVFERQRKELFGNNTRAAPATVE